MAPEEVKIDLHSHIEKWLADDTASPIAIWAGYGMGKTSYSKFLASISPSGVATITDIESQS